MRQKQQFDKWTAAEILKDEFIHNQSQRDTVDITAQLENEVEATIELSASFLVYYVAKSIAEDQSHTALLLNVFKYLLAIYQEMSANSYPWAN